MIEDAKRIREGEMTATIEIKAPVEEGKHTKMCLIRFDKGFERVDGVIRTNHTTLDDLPDIVSLATKAKDYIKGTGYKEGREANTGKVEMSLWMEKPLKRNAFRTRCMLKLTKSDWDGNQWNPTDHFNPGDLTEIEDLGKKLKDI